jgi:hypothetical protein
MHLFLISLNHAISLARLILLYFVTLISDSSLLVEVDIRMLI